MSEKIILTKSQREALQIISTCSYAHRSNRNSYQSPKAVPKLFPRVNWRSAEILVALGYALKGNHTYASTYEGVKALEGAK